VWKHNNNNDNDRLTAFDPGQPGYAGTRRNIHPLTPIRIIVLPLSSFSICNGPWHPLYSQSPYYITSAAVAVDSSHVTASSQYGTEIWRDRVPDFRGCDAEAARAKWCADKRSREEISVGESEGTSGMTGMQGWTSVSRLGTMKSTYGKWCLLFWSQCGV